MYIMVKCQNCGEKVNENLKVCPNCGEYVSNSDNSTDTNGLIQEKSPEEEFLNGPGDKNKMEDMPEENYPEQELNKKERDERSDFGR